MLERTQPCKILGLSLFVGFVETMWALVVTATTDYNDRYENSSGSSSSSNSRHEVEIRNKKTLTEAG